MRVKVNEPGEVLVGEWAHIRWSRNQHLITAEEDGHAVTACGRRHLAWMIWHHPPKPHLARCRSCLKGQREASECATFVSANRP